MKRMLFISQMTEFLYLVPLVLRLYVKYEPDESVNLSAAITGDLWWESLMNAIRTRALQRQSMIMLPSLNHDVND